MTENLIIVSLITWGIHCLLDPDQNYLFHKAGHFLERTLGTTVCKPLFLCPPCMGSVYGIGAGLILYGISTKVIVFSIALCGLNFIIKSFIYPEYVEDLPEKE